VTPLFVLFFYKNLSGHTAVLLIVVARKPKKEAVSPLFLLVSVKKNL